MLESNSLNLVLGDATLKQQKIILKMTEKNQNAKIDQNLPHHFLLHWTNLGPKIRFEMFYVGIFIHFDVSILF